MYLELGDAFQAGKAGQGNRSGAAADAEPDIKVRVRMVNINYGHNQELMEACEPLGEYAWLVGQIREKIPTCIVLVFDIQSLQGG